MRTSPTLSNPPFCETIAQAPLFSEPLPLPSNLGYLRLKSGVNIPPLIPFSGYLASCGVLSLCILLIE